MREIMHFFKHNPEWIRDFYRNLKDLWIDHKPLVITMLCSAVFVGMYALLSYQGSGISNKISLQAKQNEVVLHELNEMKSYLQEAESGPFNTKQQQTILKSLEKDINNAEKSLQDNAKVEDIKKVSTQIASAQNDIDSHLNEIKKALSENTGSKEYLDKSALPFHVISVDVIAGQPYVSIEYANHITPLAVGDVLIDWRVIRADYEASMAEFVNDKNQHVKISL
jgi:hypothetical protein